VETTIPVFSGMSGGPAFWRPDPGTNLIAFGVVSSDQEDPIAGEPSKFDEYQAGSTIIAPLKVEHVERDELESRFRIVLPYVDAVVVRSQGGFER
jgi:hypothetical protein